MTIGYHLTEFAGKRVEDYAVETGIPSADIIYRIRIDWDEKQSWPDKFAQFLADPNAQQVTGIVAGLWQEAWDKDSAHVVTAIANAAAQLPNLTAVFIGDITYEECEISWLIQSDMSPIFAAYPNLTHFGVRGGGSLRLSQINHNNLQSLIVETGGLDRQVIHDVLTAQLPALEHLELWLGTDHYGANATIEDLAPLLTGNLYPNLRYLGLRDSHIADNVATAVSLAPILEKIDILDLSLGTLSDVGANALLKSEGVKQLKKLDLHHHFISDELVSKLKALPIDVDLSDAQDDEDDWRFVAVGE